MFYVYSREMVSRDCIILSIVPVNYIQGHKKNKIVSYHVYDLTETGQTAFDMVVKVNKALC